MFVAHISFMIDEGIRSLRNGFVPQFAAQKENNKNASYILQNLHLLVSA